MTPGPVGRRRLVPVGAALAGSVVAGALLSGCTAASEPEPAPAPPPPAACLLDTAALGATTGLTWTPDAATASDTRCVYAPTTLSVPGEGPAFVTVEVAPAQGTDPAGELDTVAGLCDDGSRAPVAAGDGFVCRFQGGNVFAATVRRGELVTVAASAVPPGTTAARLVIAFDQQVTALTR
jgi:hypothetical protein